jgi:uncharacterized membrane protein
LKPLVFGILVWFWIATGIISLGPGWQRGLTLVMESGASEAVAKLAVISGGFADIVIGLLIAFRKTARLGLLCSLRDFGCLRDHWHIAGAVDVVRPARTDAEDRAHHGVQPHCACDIAGQMTLTHTLLKFLHVVGAAVLLGTGAGIAFFMLIAHLTGRPATVAAVARIVVIADFVFTAAAVVAPAGNRDRARALFGLLTARRLDRLVHCSIFSTGAFWLPVIWMQMRLRDLANKAAADEAALPPAYHRLFWWWLAFGFPAFIAVLGIFWLMIARPQLPSIF